MDNTAWLKGMEALSNKTIKRLKKDIKLIESDPNILPQSKKDAIEVIQSVIRFKKGKLLRGHNGFVPPTSRHIR
jgi:hypothetical protein